MLEYAVVLAVIITALLVIGHYVRNALSSKWREAGDTFGQGEVYKPN